MKTKNFIVSFELNKKDLSSFTDYVFNYLTSENFSEIYDFDYKCSKLVLSEHYLFEVSFYDLEDIVVGLLFISTLMSRCESLFIYPVQVAHISFDSFRKSF